MSELTTIQIRKETREELKKFGRKEETYDDIIHKLVQLSQIKIMNDKWNKILKEGEFVPLDKI